jgi:uncharacterized delta-60 repeat protein
LVGKKVGKYSANFEIVWCILPSIRLLIWFAFDSQIRILYLVITEKVIVMIKNLQYISTFLLLSSFVAMPQDGTLDPSFGGDGVVFTDFGGQEDQSYAILEQEDGKIVAFGFSEYGNYQSLARYLADGSLDTSFGTDGKVINDFNNEPNFLWYGSIVQQADQKLVTGATHRLPGSNTDFFLARYLTNGDLDPSFGDNGIVMTHYGFDVLSRIAILPDGKIIAGGWSELGSSDHVLLVKYFPNGDLDPSFGIDGIIATNINYQSTIVFPFVVLEDGKILVAFRGTAGVLTFHRYLANGTLDPTFGTNGVVETNIASGLLYGSIAVKENGTIVANMSLGNSNLILAQFLADGSTDTSFGTNGITSVDAPIVIPSNVLLDQDENILVSGNNFGFEIDTFYISRYDTDGSLDSNFGSNGTTDLGFESHSQILQNDGRILVTGGTFWYSGPVDFVVVRFRNGILEIPDNAVQEFTVFPNPSQDFFTIRSDSFLNNEAYLITDMTGKVLQQGVLNDSQTTIDLSSAQSGLYFLNAGNSTLRLVKE